MPQVSPIDIVQTRLHQDAKKYGTIEIFSKKDMLFSPEEMQKKFFFVLDGRIKVSQVNFEDAKEQTLQILTKGDMCDIVTLLDSTPHNNLLHALDDVRVISFPIEIIRKWMAEDQGFNKILFPYISEHIRKIEELAIDLSFYDTTSRLLKLISKNIDSKNRDGVDLLKNLSHEEIASLIGTVRKVLNRSIQKLKSDGLLDVQYRDIKIKDRQKLLDTLPKL
jgi:CRP-like cAMP-binding protein